MIDEDFARRYRETWDLTFKRGSSLPEELDRAHMLMTSQRRRELLESAAMELGSTPPYELAALIPIALEVATFSDGVRAAIAWIEQEARQQ